LQARRGEASQLSVNELYAGASPSDPWNGKRERLPYKTRAAANTHSLLPSQLRQFGSDPYRFSRSLLSPP